MPSHALPSKVSASIWGSGEGSGGGEGSYGIDTDFSGKLGLSQSASGEGKTEHSGKIKWSSDVRASIRPASIRPASIHPAPLSTLPLLLPPSSTLPGRPLPSAAARAAAGALTATVPSHRCRSRPRTLTRRPRLRRRRGPSRWPR